MAETNESIKHIFEGHNQFRKEIEQLKIDMLAKVSKQELETQLLLKANKQSVATRGLHSPMHHGECRTSDTVPYHPDFLNPETS